MTEFQRTVKKEDLVEICKMMHPDLRDHQLKNIRFNNQYSWVNVCFSVKSYGYINFEIDNHNTGAKMFGAISKKQVEEALADGTINWRVWRITNDVKSIGIREIDEVYAEAEKYMAERYALPSVEEFYHEYMDE